MLATTSPFACASSATWPESRAERVAGAARRPLFRRGARKPGMTSGLGVNRIEIAFRHRPVKPSELDRDVVKPAGREATIEMPQSRNDYAHDWDLDVGTRLIEDKEIETQSFDEVHAGHHLLALVEAAELRVQIRSHHRIAVPRPIRMIRQ